MCMLVSNRFLVHAVIRYTKEEMMTFRQPVKILSSMVDLVDIVSTERLNPVCFERFEPEDVRLVQLCNHYFPSHLTKLASLIGDTHLEH